MEVDLLALETGKHLIRLFQNYQNQQVSNLMTNFLSDNKVFVEELKPILYDVLSVLVDKNVTSNLIIDMTQKVIDDHDIISHSESQIDELISERLDEEINRHLGRNGFSKLVNEAIQQQVENESIDYESIAQSVTQDEIFKLDLDGVIAEAFQTKLDNSGEEIISPIINSFLLHTSILESTLEKVCKHQIDEMIERTSIKSFIIKKIKSYFKKN